MDSGKGKSQLKKYVSIASIIGVIIAAIALYPQFRDSAKPSITETNNSETNSETNNSADTTINQYNNATAAKNNPSPHISESKELSLPAAVQAATAAETAIELNGEKRYAGTITDKTNNISDDCKIRLRHERIGYRLILEAANVNLKIRADFIGDKIGPGEYKFIGNVNHNAYYPGTFKIYLTGNTLAGEYSMNANGKVQHGIIDCFANID